MPKVVVIGGGWAGVAAAVAAAKLGAEVELAERTDLLLGSGLAGGVMRNNGRWTAAEELIAMGGGDVLKLGDQVRRHRNIEFPGHKHASLYDVTRIEPAVRRLLEDYDVKVHFGVRGKDVEMAGDRIARVYLDDGGALAADAFVDATGTAGGVSNCTKYGNGCVQCIYRCPAFGPRISVVAKAGVREKAGRRAGGGIGFLSGSCLLHKDSLARDIADKLNSAGVAIVPVPPHLRPAGPWRQMRCSHYALRQFAENLIVLDTGHAKLLSPYFPVETLRQIPGFEEAAYCDPCAGGRGNSVRFLALTPRLNTMQAEGVANLFCGGEKSGLAGHTEAIITGALAGHNAVRHALGKELLEFPRQLACGEAIAWVKERTDTEAEMQKKYTFAGAALFHHLQQKGLYTADKGEVRKRVCAAGMENFLAQKP